jgi:hypothetical protein
MRLNAPRRGEGFVVYEYRSSAFAFYCFLAAIVAIVVLAVTTFPAPSGASFAAATVLISLTALAFAALSPRRELRLDSVTHTVGLRRQRLWDRRDEVLTRADVRHLVLARRDHGGPYKLLYLVLASGRGRTIDRGEELSRMDGLGDDLRAALGVPLLTFDTDLSGPRLTREADGSGAVVYRDLRNHERRTAAAGMIALGGIVLAACGAVLLGALWSGLSRGSLHGTAEGLFSVAWLLGIGLIGAGVLTAFVVLLRSLRLVEVEVRAGPSVALRFLPFRGPVREEVWPGAAVAAVVKVVNRKDECRQVWLRRVDGRRVMLDRLSREMTDAKLPTADTRDALRTLARDLHEHLNVPVEVVRRRLTLL